MLLSSVSISKVKSWAIRKNLLPGFARDVYSISFAVGEAQYKVMPWE